MSVVLSLLSGSMNSTNAPASGTLESRNAFTKARRRCASAKQAGSGCTCAPRPGNLRVGSGTSRSCAPAAPPPAATTRSSSDAGARFRQPTHVRTHGAAWMRAAENARSLTGKFSLRWPVRPVRSPVWDHSRSRDILNEWLLDRFTQSETCLTLEPLERLSTLMQTPS